MATRMSTYTLLDSGAGRKLEQIGDVRVDRQSSCAWWRPRLPPERWREAGSTHVRSDSGGGHWEHRLAVPDAWTVQLSTLKLEARATPFGHVGFFPEHRSQWEWIAERIAERAGDEEVRVLNLFAYTGAATIAAARAGARVTHVDAAQGVVRWAGRNAELNDLPPDQIRWITDDARKFVAREQRRGQRYHGILLDPPSFGRANRRVWNIEGDLPPLLTALASILADQPAFFVLSCHTPGFTPRVLANLLEEACPDAPSAQCGELTIPESTGRLHPAGAYARLDLRG